MIIEILASLGLTFILKQGRIFKEIRSFFISKSLIFNDFFNCAMCIGFWAGLLIGFLCLFSFTKIICLALTTSFLGFIIQHIISFLIKLLEALEKK